MARRAHNKEERVSRRGVSTAAGLTLVAGFATLIGGFLLADVSDDQRAGGLASDPWQPQTAPLSGEPTFAEEIDLPQVSLTHLLADPAEELRAASGAPAPVPAPAAPVTETWSQPAVEVAATPPAPAPSTAVALLGDERAQDPQTLRGWIADPELAPEVRYAALRRLEQVGADLGLQAALTLLSDRESLVRLNAVAMVSRSDDPSAADALAQLDRRTRFLARRLAARR